MGYRTVLGLVLTAAVGMAQHVPFGSPVNGFPVGRPAMDSQGNLVDLTQTLALGLCCGVGDGAGDGDGDGDWGAVCGVFGRAAGGGGFGGSGVRFWVVPEYAQGPLGEGGVLDVR